MFVVCLFDCCCSVVCVFSCLLIACCSLSYALHVFTDCSCRVLGAHGLSAKFLCVCNGSRSVHDLVIAGTVIVAIVVVVIVIVVNVIVVTLLSWLHEH